MKGRFLCLSCLFSVIVIAADFNIQIADDPGQGFNDPTPTPVVGGNAGTTLGDQRRLALEVAASIWGDLIQSDVTVEVWAGFDSGLDCATHVSCAPTSMYENPPQAPVSNTLYPIALANALAGYDLRTSGGPNLTSDIIINFNPAVDAGSCGSGQVFYYGLDRQAGDGIDFVTTALRALAHGLGMFTTVNELGQPVFGTPDIFMVYLEDLSAGLRWTEMNDAQRAASSVDDGDLAWMGPAVNQAGGERLKQAVLMYAPLAYEPGVSVIHLDPAVFPDQLLAAPDSQQVQHQVGLGLAFLQDIGWTLVPQADLSLWVDADSETVTAGQNLTLTVGVANQGPDTATNVEVTNALPDAMSWQSHSGDGSFTPSSGLWQLSSIPAGQSAVLNVVVRIDASGYLTHQAEITASDLIDVDSTPGNSDEAEDDLDAQTVTAIRQIFNHQAVNDLFLQAGEWRLFQLEVNPAPVFFSAQTFNGIGDADLFLRRAQLPTLTHYDEASRDSGNAELIYRVNGLDEGTWFLGVFGSSSAGDVSMRVDHASEQAHLIIHEIDIVACPDISVHVSVADAFGTCTGLSAADFSVSLDGGPGFPPTTLLESADGHYELTYTTTAFGAVDLTISAQCDSETTQSTMSYENCQADGSRVLVWFAEDERARAGDTVFVPLKIQPVDQAYDINSLEITVAYDDTVLAYQNVIKTCTLIEPWDLTLAHEPSSGVIEIAAADPSSLAIASNFEDVLLGIEFQVLSGAVPGECASLHLVPEDFVFNNGSPTPLLGDGQLCVEEGAGAWDQADLSLKLSVNDPFPNLGDVIAIQLTLFNAGPREATNVQVLDLLPSGLTYVDHAGDGTYVPVTGVWTPPCVFPGVFRNLTIHASVDSTGVMVNHGEVMTATQTDPDSTPGNHVEAEDDQDRVTIAPAQADLELTKSVNQDTPSKGDPFTYVLTVENMGPDHAVSFEVLDQLPDGVALIGASGDGQYDEESGLWKMPQGIAAGATGSLQLQVEALRTGEISNSAEIASCFRHDPDSTPGNGNSEEDDWARISVNPLATDLSLNQLADVPDPKLGDSVTFTLSVTNHGPLDETGVQIIQRLPAVNPPVMAFGLATPTLGSFDVNTGVWFLGDLPVGHTESMVLEVINRDISEHVVCAEVVTTRHFDPDSTPDNQEEGEDDQSCQTLIPQFADLALELTASDAYPQPGQSVDFTLSIQHESGDPAMASVGCVLPSNYQFDSVTGDGSFDAGSGVWEPGSLTAGYQAQLVVHGTYQGQGEAVFRAEISASDQGDPDSTPSNGVLDEDDQVEISVRTRVADLRLTKTVDNSMPAVGENVVFTLTVFNEGPDVADQVTVLDMLPAGMSYVADNGGGAYLPGTGIWTLDPLVVDAEATLEITARLDVAGRKVNVAEIATTDAFDPDSTPGNGASEEDDLDIAVIGQADLRLQLTVDENQPAIGDLVNFALTLTNDGPDDVDRVQVDHALPRGVVVVSHSGPGTYDENTGLWTVEDLANSQQVVLNTTAQVFGTAVKTHTAEVFSSTVGDPDSTPNNNDPQEDDQANVTLIPFCGDQANFVIFNGDGPGEGFNDPHPVAPIDGNSGTTLGEQRLIAFQHAIDIWRTTLRTDIPLVVFACFDPLTCSPDSAVLGSAGSVSLARDFPGADHRDTWYPIAIANMMAGEDLNGDAPEISATFNSSIDSNNACLDMVNFYYGLTGQPSGSDIDFVTVLLHELTHGLGFITFVNGVTGERFLGRDDVYMRFLEDHSAHQTWSNLTEEARAASAVNSGDLHWVGPAVVAASDTLNSGAHGSGHVEMYAPPTYSLGQSLSHFNTSLDPDNLMEPFYSGKNHAVGLANELLADLGWRCQNDVALVDLSLDMTVDEPSPMMGEQVTFELILSNDGPDQATDVVVMNQLPNGLDHVSHVGDGEYDPTSGFWTVGALNAGASVSLQVLAQVIQLDGLTHQAEVFSAAQVDADSTPNNGNLDEDDLAHASVQPQVQPSADLSLIMSVDRTTPDVGEEVVLSLALSNHGPDRATGLQVWIQTPPELSYQMHSGHGIFDSGSGMWQAIPLNVHETDILQITMRVGDLGVLMSQAEVWSADLLDPNSTPANGDPSEDDLAQISVFPVSPDCPPGAQIWIRNMDGPGEGLNDPTPVQPVGGNPGVTLGQQRLFALQHAADMVASNLSSELDIVVDAKFDPLTCTGSAAVLGSAGSTSVVRDFPEAPLANTWYPVALANALASQDFNQDVGELSAVLNASIDDNGVLPGGDDDDCRCGAPGDPINCPSSSIIYVVERDGPERIKFENAPVGLGEDRESETDRFVIRVADGTSTVTVSTKAARDDDTFQLTGVGDFHVDALGFCTVLERMTIDGWYSLAVSSVCNRHALSHVEFGFGAGTVLSPDQTCTATRTQRCQNASGTGDGSCLPGVQWYYGFDRQAGGHLDIVTVFMHELMHGLGFSTFVNLDASSGQAGSRLLGHDDAFMVHLQDFDAKVGWNQMSDAERMQSAVDSSNLVWTGSHVAARSSALITGAKAGGEVEMYAPNPVQLGSSVNHWSTQVNPLQLLGPYYMGPTHELGLALDLLYDLGWFSQACTDLSLTKSVDLATPDPGDSVIFTLAVLNDGPGDASGVKVRDLLPNGLTFVTDDGAGSYDPVTGIWDVGILTAGFEMCLNITATVNASGVKTNVAEIVAAHQKDPDSIPDNHQAFEDDQDQVSVGNADLSLTWQASGVSPALGSVVDVQLLMENDGPDDPTSIMAQIVLPQGLQVASTSGDGVYAAAEGTWTLSPLPSGNQVALAFTLLCEEAGLQPLSAEIIHSDLTDPDSTPGSGVGEDDEAQLDLNVQLVSQALQTRLHGVFPETCPEMSPRVIVESAGLPVSGLETGDFSLWENGQFVTFSAWEYAEDPGVYGLSYNSPQADGGNDLVSVEVTHDGHTATASADFNNCNTAGCTELMHHVSIPNISAYRGDIRCYRIAVPPTQRMLRVEAFGGEGDADLLIRYGQEPTALDWDYRPAMAGNDEGVTVIDPQAGDWYVGLHAFGEYVNTNLAAHYYPTTMDLDITGVFTDNCPQVEVEVRVIRNDEGVQGLGLDHFSLSEDGLDQLLDSVQPGATGGDYVLRYTTPQPDGEMHELQIQADILGDVVSDREFYQNCHPACAELTNHQVEEDLSGQLGSWRCFFIDVPQDQDVLTFDTWGGTGDVDLVVRFGAEPTADLFDYRPLESGNLENVTIMSPAAGRWYVSLFAYVRYEEVSLVAHYFTQDLNVEILSQDLGDCPSIHLEAMVTWDGAPLTGLLAADFRIAEGAGGPFIPNSATEMGPGIYDLEYATVGTSTSEVLVNLIVHSAGKSAAALTSYGCCNVRGPCVEVWVNSDHAAPANATLTIPVWCGPVDAAYEVQRVAWRLVWDDAVLEYQGWSSSNGLLQNWSIHEDAVAGDLRLECSSLDGGFLSTGQAENTLLLLHFKVNASAQNGDCTPLDLVDADFWFNVGRPRAVVYDGLFCVVDCPAARGDVDRDGNDEEAWDALQILLAFLEGVETPYDPIPLCVADTNCSGEVSLHDVVLVLQKTVSLIQGYCLEPGVRARSTFTVNVPEEARVVDSLTHFELPVELTQRPDEAAYGMQFDLVFDPNRLSFHEILNQQDTLTEHWGVPFSISLVEPGRLRIIHAYPLSEIAQSGILAILQGYAMQPGATSVVLEGVELGAPSETRLDFGPFAVDVTGESWCTQDVLEQRIAAWRTDGTSVLNILCVQSCLACGAP